MFTIHATCEVKVRRQPVDPKLLEEAIERPILAYGQPKAYDNGKVVVLNLRSGYNGLSLAVQNLHDTSIEVTIELKLVNAVTSADAVKVAKVIRSNDVEVLHHVMPATSAKWSWGYSSFFQEME
jgi:hypothetical protein